MSQGIKYSYLTEAKIPYDIRRFKKLCLAIATVVEQTEDGQGACYWSVAFKAPSDQFNKVEARAALDENLKNPMKSGRIVLPKGYKHHEIIGKVLFQLAANETALTPVYRDFVKVLIMGGIYTQFLAIDA